MSLTPISRIPRASSYWRIIDDYSRYQRTRSCRCHRPPWVPDVGVDVGATVGSVDGVVVGSDEADGVVDGVFECFLCNYAPIAPSYGNIMKSLFL